MASSEQCFPPIHIMWTTFRGRCTVVGITEADSDEDAWTVAIRVARARGWSPPRWWQWWRWQDTRLPQALRHLDEDRSR
jgi:hypothetical protein